jgi:hypothetical protein
MSGSISGDPRIPSDLITQTAVALAVSPWTGDREAALVVLKATLATHTLIPNVIMPDTHELDCSVLRDALTIYLDNAKAVTPEPVEAIKSAERMLTRLAD